jgi:hypothetical protein
MLDLIVNDFAKNFRQIRFEKIASRRNKIADKLAKRAALDTNGGHGIKIEFDLQN